MVATVLLRVILAVLPVRLLALAAVAVTVDLAILGGVVTDAVLAEISEQVAARITPGDSLIPEPEIPPIL